MSDKKNEDFTVRMPDQDLRSGYGSEKQPFLAPRPSMSRSALPINFSRAENSPGLAILAYCLASISMTIVNKYVVSGTEWNLYFFYLAVQVSKASAQPDGLGRPQTRSPTFAGNRLRRGHSLLQEGGHDQEPGTV